MMSPSIELHPSLSDDTVLYRTLDFFSAASIVKNQQLMFTRGDKFSDMNEGIRHLFSELELTFPGSGCGFGWHDKESAKSRLERIKGSHYISCWSKLSDLVAMWSLYSPDYSSVRISTTISKLRNPIEALLNKYSINRFTMNDFGSKGVFVGIVAIEAHVAPIKYDNLLAIARKMQRRVKARRKIADRYKNNIPMQTTSRREEQRLNADFRSSFELKDISFQHEAEIRLSIRLGEGPCVYTELDDTCLPDQSYQIQHFAKQFVLSKSLPEREFSPCSSNLIDTVAIDPRCPVHKAEFIRNWFLDRGITVVQSECFGYLPDTFQVYPEF